MSSHMRTCKCAHLSALAFSSYIFAIMESSCCAAMGETLPLSILGGITYTLSSLGLSIVSTLRDVAGSLSTCICVCVWKCICLSTCMCVSVCLCVFIWSFEMRSCVDIWSNYGSSTMAAHIHICMYTYIHTYIHTYINTYIHTYIYVYIYKHIHTYIHNYTLTKLVTWQLTLMAAWWQVPSLHARIDTTQCLCNFWCADAKQCTRNQLSIRNTHSQARATWAQNSRHTSHTRIKRHTGHVIRTTTGLSSCSDAPPSSVLAPSPCSLRSANCRSTSL